MPRKMEKHFQQERLAPGLEERLRIEVAAEQFSERAMNRFVLQVRVVGFTLVTLQALVIVLSVYASVARLPWLS